LQKYEILEKNWWYWASEQTAKLIITSLKQHYSQKIIESSKPKSFEKSFYILSLIALASCKSSSVITSSSAENNKESANQIITEIVNTASENIGFSINGWHHQSRLWLFGISTPLLAIITSNFPHILWTIKTEFS
jgi:hypothetical protein